MAPQMDAFSTPLNSGGNGGMQQNFGNPPPMMNQNFGN